MTDRAWTAVTTKNARLMPISAKVTIGRCRDRAGDIRAPATVRGTAARWPLASATQARQWKPTLAGVRHSGHAGRPQRLQDSAVLRSGCHEQVVTWAGGGGTPGGSGGAVNGGGARGCAARRGVDRGRRQTPAGSSMVIG